MALEKLITPHPPGRFLRCTYTFLGDRVRAPGHWGIFCRGSVVSEALLIFHVLTAIFCD